MKIMVVLAHPLETSFNRALALEAVEALKANGHTVWYHDLYDENFNPVMQDDEMGKHTVPEPFLKKYCAEVPTADGFVIVHPNWWGLPPAVLTGWVDRVFRSGIAYRFEGNDPGAGVPTGLLQAGRALVINTGDTPPEREAAVFHDPLDTIWKNCIFGFCGVPQVERVVFSVVVTSTPEQRAQWLRETRETVNRMFPKAKD